MLRYLYLLGGVSVAAIVWADLVTDDSGAMSGLVPPPSDPPATIARAEDPVAEPAPLSGVVRIRANQGGHHVGHFRLNGVPVDGMIDTGATTIAINRTTARRAGVLLENADFIYPVETANGRVMAARTTLERVTIGSIQIRDVQAMVLDDRALNVTLIGMSFLRELRSFAYENGTLVLRR